MAVAAADPAVPVVDAQFTTLISADVSAAINSFLLGFVVTASAVTTPTPHVPAALLVWHYVMTLRSLAHMHTPCILAFCIALYDVFVMTKAKKISAKWHAEPVI